MARGGGALWPSFLPLIISHGNALLYLAKRVLASLHALPLLTVNYLFFRYFQQFLALSGGAGGRSDLAAKVPTMAAATVWDHADADMDGCLSLQVGDDALTH